MTDLERTLEQAVTLTLGQLDDRTRQGLIVLLAASHRRLDRLQKLGPTGDYADPVVWRRAVAVTQRRINSCVELLRSNG